MNGQDPNQNLNNINPEGLDVTPAQSPVNDPATVPAAPAAPAEAMVQQAAPAETLVQQPAPMMPDSASVMPQAPETPVAPVQQVPAMTNASAAAPVTLEQPTASVMPDSASVMPQVPEAPVAPVETPTPQVAVMPDATQIAPQEPVMPDPASVMATPAPAPVMSDATQAPVTPNPNNQASVTGTPIVDPNAAAPAGEETPAKKGIAIDKNVIIIVAGIVIIIVVLLVAWKSGLIFSSKKPVTPPAASGNVTGDNNNTTPVEPSKKPQNTKEAKQKMDNIPWFLELVQMRYSDLDSSKDILEDTDNLLFIAYELFRDTNSVTSTIVSSSTCDIDAEAIEVTEINKLLNKVFDDELVNKNLTNSTYKIYTKNEYEKLESSDTCANAKTCNDSKNCKVTDSYILFDTETTTRENVAKYEDLSYEGGVLTGKLVLSYGKDTREGLFTIKFDDNDLIKSIEIEK